MENSRESFGSPSTIGLILIAVIFWAAGGFIAYQNGIDWFLPDAASVEAESVDNLFRFMLGVGTFIFLLVETSLFYFVVRYGFMRNRDDDSDGPPIHGNNLLEFVWTIIPSIIVFVLTILSFQVLLDTTEAKDNEFEIDVTAQRFFWTFGYPVEGDADLEFTTSHILVLPEGETIRLNMTSVDVIHAFWVPAFRVKQDVMPGRISELRFTPNQTSGLPPDFELLTLEDLDVPGPDDACPVEDEITAPEVDVAEAVDETVDAAASEQESEDAGSAQPPVDYENGFDLVCAELCGLDHGLMRGKVFVVEREEYDAFIETLRARQIADAAQAEYGRRCGGAALLEAGRTLFGTGTGGFNCARCHQLDDASSFTMGAGPSLNGIGTRAAARPGYDGAEDYLLTSIINPNAFIVDGYQPNIMLGTFADQMTPEQLETMVSYLALQTEE